VVGAGDVTNGVRERRSLISERGKERETKVIVLIIETSKGRSLEDGGGGVVLSNRIRGTSAYGALMEERGKACQERKQKRESKQGNIELRKKGSLILFMEAMTQASYSWNCPKLSCVECHNHKTSC
jgi:hypothetical protein